MKFKNLLITAVLGSALLFAGCTSGSSGSSGSKTNGFDPSAAFNGGDNALSISFEKNAPPQSVRDQGLQGFQVRLLVKNEGEYDIEENSAYVSLSGIDKNVYNIVESSKAIPALNGYKVQGKQTIEGRTQFVLFNDLKYTGEVLGTTSETIFANICYPYQTKASSNLCISGDTTVSVDDNLKICDLESTRKVASSGGPISIQNVKQYPSGTSKVDFQFDIVHKPKTTTATLFQSNSIDSDCKIQGNLATSSQAIQFKDKVRYTVNTGLNNLNCEGKNSNSNDVILFDNKYTVVCTQDTSGQEEFEKPFSVTVEYDYLDRISTDISIEHINR